MPRAGDWHYWRRIIEGGHRAKYAFSPVPTTLHFHADWKTTLDTHSPEVTAAREIAATSSWWPASMRPTMSPGVPEQAVFDALIRRPGYIERLRHDVTLVVDRLAWMRLTDTPVTVSQLQRALVTAEAREREASAALEAVVSSTSWRATLASSRAGLCRRQRGRQTSRPASLHRRGGAPAFDDEPQDVIRTMLLRNAGFWCQRPVL